jgi:hypothetical protein
MSPQQAADPIATNASVMTPPAQPVMLPPSYVQELLWMMDRASPGSSAYNVPRARRLSGCR